MEFFGLATVRMSSSDIQRNVNIDNLSEWCASIDKVLDVQNDERGDIYCVWGEFRVHRELIHDGVRFTLPSCKNGVQWTLTPNPDNSAQVQIHCTINRSHQDPDFIESLESFVNDWRDGLEAWAARRAARHNRACADCGDTFGGFG
ncbi:MAG: hypothetical protein ACNA75_11305 [Thiohalomonadaceae bacterium]